MNVMMGFGPYRFSLNTSAYQQLRRRIDYRWQAQNRLGTAAAMQYIGPGQDEITLEGSIYPHFKGGLKQIHEMKMVADLGEPLMLIDGLGNIWGHWVIASIEETQEVFLDNGTPRKISFQLSLIHYGEL